MGYFQKGLTLTKSVSQLLVSYEVIRFQIDAAYESFEAASKEYDSVFNTRDYPARFAESRKSKEDLLIELRVNAWRFLYSATGAEKLVSAKRRKAFEESCTNKTLPEFSEAEVVAFLQSLQQGATTLAKETVREVFDMLRPGVYRKDYKTNGGTAVWKLGDKIILDRYIDTLNSIYFGVRINTSYETELIQLDRVFHLLDGQGIPDGYRSPLVDAINTIGAFGVLGETKYFRFRAYKKGTLHLEFKRPDLVKQINGIAGAGENILGGF